MMCPRVYIKKIVTPVLVILVLGACSQEPVDIHINSDQCAHCRMMISDSRFAAQVVTTKGKAYAFDSIECMIGWQHDREKNEQDMAWVSNFEDPGEWINAELAVFIKSEVVNSPMGAGLLSFSDLETAREHQVNYPGEIVKLQKLFDDVPLMSMGHSQTHGDRNAD